MKFDNKFKTPSGTHINDMLKQLTYDIDLYIQKVSSYYDKPVAYFKQWRCLVLKESKQKSSSIVSYNEAKLFKHIIIP